MSGVRRCRQRKDGAEVIDTNEIGAFILHCRQVAYLRQIRGMIDQRLGELETPGDVCHTCHGRKTIVRGFGTAKQEMVPCPACARPDDPASPTSVEAIQDRDERLNGLQEVVLRQTARIAELEAKLGLMTNQPDAVVEEVQAAPEQVSEVAVAGT
jgi:hypothetical protein